MIRISSIELHDFKNIENGIIEFPTAGTDPKDLEPGADIVGIYGQNGSGKTAVIDALRILKGLLSGDGYDKQDAMEAFFPGKNQFVLTLSMDYDDEHKLLAKLQYEVRFSNDGVKVWVSHEKLSCKGCGDDFFVGKTSLRTILEIEQPTLASAPILSPKGTWKSLLAVSDTVKTNYLLRLGLAQQNGYSLIVNHEAFSWLVALLSGAYRTHSAEEMSELSQLDFDLTLEPPQDAPQTFKHAYRNTLCPLAFFIPTIGCHFAYNVGLVTTLDHAACSLNLMRLNPEVRQNGFGGKPLTISLSETTELKNADYEHVQSCINGISRVMGSIIPGFSIEMKDLGARISDNGNEVKRVEFLSCRDGVRIPLRCESEGVRKLISLSTALIEVHTRPDAFVAIDEIDAGIFEYLLGELLSVIETFGKGQLLFTAHNLRALEMLPARDIVLTTTNPQKRFITFKGHRPSNNLRDQYLRAINLGGQDEEVYASTNKYEIDEALYNASRDAEEAGA